MANVKVLRTDGKLSDLEKEFPTAFQLTLISKGLNVKNSAKEIGDYLTSAANDHVFALLVKELPKMRMNISALRLSIIQLFSDLIKEEKIQTGESETPIVILISKYDFKEERDETSFICSLKELMMTYFGEAINSDITLIIYGYSDSEITITI